MELFIVLAILAILIHFLYWEEGQKPWLNVCLCSLPYTWVLIKVEHAVVHLVAEVRKYPETSAYNYDAINLADDNPKTCSIGSNSGCKSMGSSRAKAPGESLKLDDTSKFIGPARDRVVQVSSKGGDGINISLPLRMQVKAVEEDEAAFTGDALKNKGNMILIRHLNGNVPINVHNTEFKVTQGDKGTRGQIIALSG